MAAIAAAQTGSAEQVGYLWPCNVIAWACWVDAQSQWRMGMSGPSGLDYAGIGQYLTEEGHVGPERKDIFKGIRAAEGASLEAWSNKRRQDAANQP